MKQCWFILFTMILVACSGASRVPATITAPGHTEQKPAAYPEIPAASTPAPSPTPLPTRTAAATLTSKPSPMLEPTSTQAYPIAFGIDYARPEKYLEQGEQTRLSDPSIADGLRLEQQQNQRGNIAMLGRIYFWIKGGFETWRAGGATIGIVTVDELFASHKLGGCHDWALVYASLARELGYPAVMLDALSLAWAKEYQSGSSKGFTGHVFVEVYVDGRWVLVDSTNNWFNAADYDPANPIIPLKGGIAGTHEENYGFYVMRKGLDSWDYGIHSNQELTQLMGETAPKINLESLVYPNYEFKRFQNGN